MLPRVVTAAVLIPLALLAIAMPEPWMALVLAAVLAGAAVAELARLCQLSPPVLVLIAFPIYAVWLAARQADWATFSQLTALSLFGAVCATLAVRRRSRLILEAASLWILAPLAAAVLLQRLGPDGLSLARPLVLALVPLWAGDTLGYLVGRSIGKRPLAPGISPKKTLEGTLANLIGCLAAAALLGPVVAVPTQTAIICGLIAGVLGQAGDLLESWLKRQAGVKDSGSVLPGHGGVLDRIDSLLLSLPAQALVIALTLRSQR